MSSRRNLQSAVSAACYVSTTLCQIMPQFTCLAQKFQRLQVPINSAQAVDEASDTFGRYRFDFRATFLWFS